MELFAGANLTFVEGEFGGPVDVATYDISVDTSLTKMLNNDPDALSVTFVNVGANTVYMMYDNNPSSTRGIVLFPGGGSATMNVRDDQILPSLPWWGIADTAASEVTIIRLRRYSMTYTNPEPAIILP